ncbi:Rrf2 family transcriptional regulator [Rhizobium sp.]
MKTDSKLSVTLHVLLHMAERGKAMTSAELAAHMDTNPVVVRRTMAGLRERGFVRSEKGHGGGWEIAADLEKITLKDVHDALGAPRLLAIGINLENPSCLVEQAVNRALTSAFHDAEELLVARLGDVTLAQLAADFRHHAAIHRAAHQKKDI